MEAGKEHGLQLQVTLQLLEGLKVECLSYHADADIHTNPFELGFDRLVNLDNGS